MGMLLTNLKIAWRHLVKNKTFSFINIAGLAVGITCSLLIIFHVKDELSYDKGFTGSDRTYRITFQEIGENARHWAAVSPPMAGALQQFFPEIEKVARFQRPSPYQLLSDGGTKRFEEKGGFFADEDAVSMFNMQFVAGNPATALTEMDAIVLTEQMAAKYFGKQDPIGKTLQDDRKKLPLKVTGVIRAFPFPTHLQFDYLLSMPTITRYQEERQLQSRSWSAFYTYVQLRQPEARKKLEARMGEFMVGYFNGESRNDILTSRLVRLQPITAIHLHSKLEKEMYPNGDITYVYIFSIAALFILLIAAVNFINISTAMAFNRMKEIGLRKVVGAGRGQLIRQFIGESLFVTFVAALLALGLLQVAVPFYNDITGKAFHFNDFGLLALLVVGLGVLAGLYPAWFVSNFNAIGSLKAKKDNTSPVNLVRKGLIVFQFVVSVFMLFSTIIVYRQLQLFHKKDLGFDKEQVVAVTMYNMWDKYEALIKKVNDNPAISQHAIASHLPGDRFGMESFTPMYNRDQALPDCRTMWSDENMLPALGIHLLAGRNFVNQFPTIKRAEYILNETAAKGLHLQQPLGAQILHNGDTGTVVGIIKDFNFASLHSNVEPLVLQYNPYNANYLLLKVRPNKAQQTIAFMQQTIQSLAPDALFTYTFLDDRLERLYAAENRMSRVFKAFAGLAIFISCLGLFGLSAYAAQLRIKEVGIRKVLGASVQQITVLLSKDFMWLVGIATVIAWPLAWYVMHQWLNGFAYRITIDIWVFVLSGCCAFLLALATVSFQAIRAALLNPVKNLRTEV